MIDREEVARLLRELGISMTRDKLEYAMHQMDPNGDNEISFEEFEAWYDKQEVRAHPSLRLPCRDAFRRRCGCLDACSGPFLGLIQGLLARTEDESLVRSAAACRPTQAAALTHPILRCSQVGKKVTSLRDAFKRADKQGGGTIDRDELQQMCIALTLPKETQAAMLNQIDMDGDGEWCYAEVRTSTPSFPSP